MNPRDVYAKISEIMEAGQPPDGGVANDTVSTYVPHEIVPAANFDGQGALADQQVIDDAAFSRRVLQEVVETGQEALQQAVAVAAVTGNPETFNAISGLMKEIADCLKKLVALQGEVTKVSTAKRKLSAMDGTGESVVDGNRFVGTTQDMLKLLREAREGRVGDVVDSSCKVVKPEGD